MGKGRAPWKPTGNIHIDAATMPMTYVKKHGKVTYLRKGHKRDPQLLWAALLIVNDAVLEYLKSAPKKEEKNEL